MAGFSTIPAGGAEQDDEGFVDVPGKPGLSFRLGPPKGTAPTEGPDGGTAPAEGAVGDGDGVDGAGGFKTKPVDPPSAAADSSPLEGAPEGAPDTNVLPETPPLDPQVQTFGEAAVSGAVRTSGIIPGAKTGAALGARVGAAGGPVSAAVGTAVGAFIGMAGGYFAGDLAADELERQGLGITDPYALPENLRTAAVMGEGFGAGTALGLSTMGLAQLPGRLPESTVGNVINGVLDMAKNQPIRFFAAETAANVQATIAEGAFESVRPGQPMERGLVGMMAGGVNLTRVSVGASAKVLERLKAVVTQWSASGKQARAAKLIAEFIAAADEAQDPQVLIRALRDTDDIAKTIPGFRGTAAQTTGDLRLAQLEAELAEKDRAVGKAFEEQANDTLTAISNAIAALKGQGDPASLVAISELRQIRYRHSIDRVLAHAQREAIDLAEGVSQGATKAERGSLSKQVSEIYERALGRARDVETELWEGALAGVADRASPWKKAKAVEGSLRGELSRAAALPKFITDEMDAVADAVSILKHTEAGVSELPDGSRITAKMIKEAQKTTSVAELQRFRRDLLARARGLARSTDELADTTARQYSLMAEAVLDDMVAAGAATKLTASGARRGQGGRLGAEETAFDQAREYTRQLNETFTRSFGGRLNQPGAYGLQLPPEALLKRAFASGDEVGALQLQELAAAVDFLPSRTFGNPALLAEANADSRFVMDAQSRFLRIMAGQSVRGVLDPETGLTILKTDVGAARAFLENSEAILSKDAFSGIKESLEAAVKSQETFAAWAQRARGITRHLKNESALARVLKFESPADAVRGALISPKPIEALDELERVSRGVPGGGGPEALRAAIFDHIIRAAQTPDKQLSLQRMVDGLLEPIRPGDFPSLGEYMKAKGLLPPDATRRVDELVEAANRVMAARNIRAVGEDVLDPTSAIEALLVRATGSEVARRMLAAAQPQGVGAGGPTLIVAYQGAKAAQDLLNRLPNKAVQQIIVDAMKGEPLKAGDAPFTLLDALVSKGKTPAKQLQKFYLLHAYAWQAGLLGAEDEIERVSTLADEGRLFRSQRGQAAPALDADLAATIGAQPDAAALPAALGEPLEAPLTSPDEPAPEAPPPIADPAPRPRSFETEAEPAPIPGQSIIPGSGEGESGSIVPTDGKGAIKVTGVAQLDTFDQLAEAVEQVESGGDENAVSPVGAIGPMQVMPTTLRMPGYGVTPARDGSIQENRRVGRDLLAAFLRRYGGNLDHALAAYNWGPGNTNQWLAKGAKKSKLPKETRNYLKRVRAQIKSRASRDTTGGEN